MWFGLVVLDEAQRIKNADSRDIEEGVRDMLESLAPYNDTTIAYKDRFVPEHILNRVA